MSRRIYDFMDVDRWMEEGYRGKRVICGGVDVTDRCVAFNDRQRWARCYARMPPRFEEDGQIEMVTISGEIEVIGNGVEAFL